MENKAVGREYVVRNMTSGIELVPSKSPVDWKRVKRLLMLPDSSDESSGNSAKEEHTCSEDEKDDIEKDDIVLKNWLLDQEEKRHSEEVTGDSEDGRIIHGKRKRFYSSLLYDSDESEDSGILVRKALAKRCCMMDEDESSEEGRASWRSSSSENFEDSNNESELEEEPLHCLPLSTIASSEIDGDGMNDVIGEEDDADNIEHVKSEKQPQQEELLNTSNSDLLAGYIPFLSYCDHYVHFKRVVEAFLTNAIDDTFLCSLYDGTTQEKSALDLLPSLHYLDERFIQPRLVHLVSRSRWKDRYKEHLDCYPDIQITVDYSENKACEACELNRSCEFNVLLSGKLYNSRTLEVDDFTSDDKQVLKVGMVCADRTRVYHRLKHFKYKLYVDCCSVSKLDGVEGEAVRDKVKWLLSRLENCGWILKRYNDLEDYMNDADKFQENR